MRFALNHMTAPALPLEAFFALTTALGLADVEIRNDLAGVAIADGTPAAAVKAAAEGEGIAILSINALQRFNDWTPARQAEAAALADYAAAAGAKGLVLVPVCDGTPADQGALVASLAALKPLLAARGLVGLVEPLGFTFCSLRSKTDAVAAIDAVDGAGVFKLVHDTFHHHLAGEVATFPARTGLVHISGVTEPDVAVDDMRDPHRVLVGPGDRLDNAGQIRALIAGGYAGAFSFEPFAPAVHGLADPAPALAESIAFLTTAAA